MTAEKTTYHVRTAEVPAQPPTYMVVTTDPIGRTTTVHATHYVDNASDVPHALGEALLPVFTNLLSQSCVLIERRVKTTELVVAGADPAKD